MSELEKRLKEIKARCEAANEWTAEYSEFACSLFVDNETSEECARLGFECPEDIGKLIAHAPQDLEMLVEMLLKVLEDDFTDEYGLKLIMEKYK